MAIRLQIDVLGDKLINRELRSVGHRGTDAAPAFEQIADQFLASEKRRFATKGNGTWDAIAASTRAKKAASKSPAVRANAGKVLVATGRLRRSLTVRADGDHVRIVEPRFLVFGTTVEYARFHQQGTGKLKVRKPVGFTEHAKRDAVRTLQRYIVTGSV